MTKLFTITGYSNEYFTQVESILPGYLAFKSTRRNHTVDVTPDWAEKIVWEVKAETNA